MDFNNLEKKIHYLESILETSKLINSKLDLSLILDNFRLSAKKNLDAEFCTIFLVDKKRHEIYTVAIDDARINGGIRLPLGKGIAGMVAKEGKSVITNKPYSEECFDSDIDRQIGGHTYNLCTVPMKNYSNEVIGVIQLMNKKGGFSEEDCEYLEKLAIHTAIAVENANLHKIEMENKDMMKNMELASKVQRLLLPEKLPEIKGLETSIVYKPYYQVSGDIYNFAKIGDNAVGIAIGDVSGKGIQAALIMVMITTLFTTLSKSILTTDTMCNILNESIETFTKFRSFCTFFYCIIDVNRKKIFYTNAGHHPPILIKKNNDYTILKGGGPVIGVFESIAYEQFETDFENGDTLLLYTDGVVESKNSNGEMYSEKRLIEKVIKYRYDNSNKLANLIENNLHLFIEGYEQREDDYTIISVKFID